MKLFIFLPLLVASLAFGQDETKWETLNNGSKGFSLHYRFVEDNSEITLEAKLSIFKLTKALPYTVSEGKKFIFNLENGEKIELQNNRYTETCIGCGAIGLSGSNDWGAKMYYPITIEQIELLLNNKVTSFKIYTDDSSLELPIKGRRELDLKKLAKEITN